MLKSLTFILTPANIQICQTNRRNPQSMRTLAELKAKKQLSVVRENAHYEEWETIKARILSEVEATNKAHSVNITFTEDELGMRFSTGQFILKPKLPKIMAGTVFIRSKDYVFKSPEFNKPIHGDIPKANELIRNDAGEIVGWVVVTLNRQNINYMIQM